MYPKWHARRFFWHAEFTAVPFFLNFFWPANASMSVLWWICVCTYTHTYLTPYRLYNNYRCYQITLQWNIYTRIGRRENFDWIFVFGVKTWYWTECFTTFISNRKQWAKIFIRNLYKIWAHALKSVRQACSRHVLTTLSPIPLVILIS